MPFEYSGEALLRRCLFVGDERAVYRIVAQDMGEQLRLGQLREAAAPALLHRRDDHLAGALLLEVRRLGPARLQRDHLADA